MPAPLVHALLAKVSRFVDQHQPAVAYALDAATAAAVAAIAAASAEPASQPVTTASPSEPVDASTTMPAAASPFAPTTEPVAAPSAIPVADPVAFASAWSLWTTTAVAWSRAGEADDAYDASLRACAAAVASKEGTECRIRLLREATRAFSPAVVAQIELLRSIRAACRVATARAALAPVAAPISEKVRLCIHVLYFGVHPLFHLTQD